LGARAAALVAGAEAPAAALHRSWPKSAAPGSVGLRFGLGSMIVLRVIHLGPRLVSGRAGVARATAAAGRFTPASDSMPTEAEKGGKRSAPRFLTHVRSFGGSPEDQGSGGAPGSRWRRGACTAELHGHGELGSGGHWRGDGVQGVAGCEFK
jgi:hypothetical protein